MAEIPVHLAVILLAFLAHGVYSGPQIADLNVLLPPRMTNPVHYRLLGSGGCFSWTWDHHEILHVEPEYIDTNWCSTSARLVSIAPYSGRKETAVYSTDINTGTVIRCEVFIDKISRIQIFHHSVKLDLDGYSTLQIRAFDSEDNVFSSLAGLRFVWKLMPKSIVSDPLSHHLVHVPLKETPLTDCGGFCGDLDTQIRVEDSGMGSDLYVVKGIEIGHEIVSAVLFEPEYENVTDKIVLTVAEAMSLHPPSPVFVIVGSLLQYELRIIRQNKPQTVDLPSSFHQWSASNSTIARVDSEMGSAKALNFGITHVIVDDTRVTGHFQISTLHVVLPDKLCLYIMPISGAIDSLTTMKYSSSLPWYVVIGREYAVLMKAFTQEPDANEIHITESNRLTLGSNSPDLWDISTVSNDMAVRYGWQNSRILIPLSIGQGYLSGSLSFNREDRIASEILKVEQHVIVCDEVTIEQEKRKSHLKIIKLPWAPGVYQGLGLKASGGCGVSYKDYSWSSTNLASVSVSSSGYIKAIYPGLSSIRATSLLDPLNFDEIIVEVSIPTSMTLSHKFPVEAAVGTHLFSEVALKTSDGSYFDLCDAFNTFVRWRVVSESEIFLVTNRTVESIPNLLFDGESEEISGSHCSWRYFYASNSGRAVIHASFSSKTQSSDFLLDAEVSLQTSGEIAAYHSLAIFQTGSGDQYGGYHWEYPIKESLHDLYLAPGSSMDVMISGGPDRWSQSVEYIDTVEVKSERDFQSKGVFLKKTSTYDGIFYRILCRTEGNFNLVFSRGNLVGDNHPFPAVSNVEMALVCCVPFSIALIVNEQSNTPDAIYSSTREDRISPIVVANGRTIRIAAIGSHNNGRPFGNSSSLQLIWELRGCEGLAKWAAVGNLEWERFLILENSSGLCTVRVSVIGFSGKITEDKHQLPKISEGSLADARDIQIVSLLRIVPESVLLYFNPEAQVNLSIVGGTCFTNAIMNDTKVAEIVDSSKSSHCSKVLVKSRGLGTAIVTVYDIGLSPPVLASASVTVADVDWIKIIGDDEISLMEGMRNPIEMMVGTSDGRIFDPSMYFYMGIYAHFGDNVIDLEYEDGSSAVRTKKLHGSKFFLRAQNLGLTSLSISVRQRSGHEIYSQIIKVEVYPQLRIYPRGIFLVPGASYMFYVEGGPTLVSGVDYASLDNDIVTMDGTFGKVKAIAAGNTTVSASMYDTGGSLLCEAFAEVEVGIPSVSMLSVQSEQLCVGCQMPVFPLFLKGDLFSFYEVCKDYTWSVDNEKVLSLGFSQHSSTDSHFQKESSNKLDHKDYGFLASLHGRSEGLAKVSISFTCHFVTSDGLKMSLFNASRSIRVMPMLPLALGLPITWILPPSYTTTDLLPGYSESHKQSDLPRKKTSIVYSSLSSCGKDNLDGIVIDGSKIRTGRSNVLDCIQAKDQSGRLEIAACVRIAEVAQLRAIAGSSSYAAYLLSDDVLEIPITYCDNLGYPFREAYGVTALDVQTNYPNVLAIDISLSENKSLGHETLRLQAKNRGSALVKVSFKNYPSKAAYILVVAGPHLLPINPVVYAGSVSKFHIAEADGLSDVASGHWLSANESVISVDKHSGQARALAEGITQVIYKAPSLKLQTTVTVKKVDSVSVNPPSEIITNVPFPVKGHKFWVHFRDDLVNTESDSGILGLDLPFDCHVEPSFIGYVTPWRDNSTGELYCLFFPYSPSTLANSLSNLKSNGMPFISVSASLKRAPDISGSSGPVLFVGGFSVSEHKLTLTPELNKTRLTILGNTDVEISWDNRRLLSVTPVLKNHLGFAGRMEYEVEALKGGRFSDIITIKLPATGQTAHISVNYEDERERTTLRERNSFLSWAAILVSLSLLASTIIIFLKFMDRPVNSRSTPPPSAPVSSDVATPSPAGIQSLSPPGIQSSSPRTPQPFVDYVRRTVDETPYYRRETRRRFDPQRTY